MLITNRGPNPPACQTPYWAAAADISVVYPGSKSGQAQDPSVANLSSPLFIIGYSAGADTALIFADDFTRRGGRVIGMALLGVSFSGQMGITTLTQEYERILDELLAAGTYVYLLDDFPHNPLASSYTPSNPSNYTYVYSNREHLDSDSLTAIDQCVSGKGTPLPGPGDGTNNDPAVVEEIFGWFRLRGVQP